MELYMIKVEKMLYRLCKHMILTDMSQHYYNQMSTFHICLIGCTFKIMDNRQTSHIRSVIVVYQLCFMALNGHRLRNVKEGCFDH